MDRDNKNKLKLLRLLELLRQETDEQHPMTTEMICQRLSENGIGCERQTLALDIKALNDAGYEVMCVRSGHSKAYYVEDRSFSLPELKILIDAVQVENAPISEAAQEQLQNISEYTAQLFAMCCNSVTGCTLPRRNRWQKAQRHLTVTRLCTRWKTDNMKR